MTAWLPEPCTGPADAEAPLEYARHDGADESEGGADHGEIQLGRQVESRNKTHAADLLRLMT